MKRTFFITDAILLILLIAIMIWAYGAAAITAIVAILGAYGHGYWTGATD
jgi:hypothetical protein